MHYLKCLHYIPLPTETLPQLQKPMLILDSGRSLAGRLKVINDCSLVSMTTASLAPRDGAVVTYRRFAAYRKVTRRALAPFRPPQPIQRGRARLGAVGEK